MTVGATNHHYAIHYWREDGSPVAQVPVDIDWEPVREWVRLYALAGGRPAAEALQIDCVIEPIWHSHRKQPYVEGFAASPAGGDHPAAVERVSFLYLADHARHVAAQLVGGEKLRRGEVYRWLPVAFPNKTAARCELPRIALRTRPARPDVLLHHSSLEAYCKCARPHEDSRHDDFLDVFVPGTVLEEIAALGHEATPNETGGVLIGHLHRDLRSARLFLEVTAQIPALHTDAGSTHLTFTQATWTQVRAAIHLRQWHETWLGWWHSHPVREWCKACSLESQRACRFARGFLSEEDRTLHKTVFSRAFSVALLVNDVAFGTPTFALFGWRRALIEPRGFHTLIASPPRSRARLPTREVDHAPPAAR